MKYTILFISTIIAAIFLSVTAPVLAQVPTDVTSVSPQKAVALNMLFPGLGHRYVQGGNWRGSATLYALADVGFWLGLIGTELQYQNLISNYETLAASRAGAYVDGKDRQFFLNLASYRSSDEYLQTQLRNRNWSKLDYVADRAFQWNWDSEENFLTFRDMREDAESMKRRRTVFITVLVVNRLISGLAVIRAARRAETAGTEVAFSLAPPPRYSTLPVLNVNMKF